MIYIYIYKYTYIYGIVEVHELLSGICFRHSETFILKGHRTSPEVVRALNKGQGQAMGTCMFIVYTDRCVIVSVWIDVFCVYVQITYVYKYIWICAWVYAFIYIYICIYVCTDV